MKDFRAFRTESGFSLVSVIVAAGIFAIIATSMMMLFENMHSTNNGIKFRLDADTVNEEMRALLTSTKACINTFGGRPANASANYTDIVIRDDSNSPGLVKYDIGGIYGDNTAVLQTNTFKDYVAGVGGKPIMLLTTVYRSNKPLIGPGTVPRKIEIGLELNSSGVIISCAALSKSVDGLWQRSTANLNNIFYNSGFVGVGSTDPKFPLDISSPGKTAVIRGSSNQMYIYDSDSTSSARGVKFNVDSDRFLLHIVNGTPEADTGAGSAMAPMVVFLQSPGNGASGPVGAGNVMFSGDIFLGGYNRGLNGARVGENGDMWMPWCNGSGCWLSGAFVHSSDIRLKTNIENLPSESGLESLMKLNPITFEWKDSKRAAAQGKQIGFIAQEVEKIYPEAVVINQKPMDIESAEGKEHIENVKSIQYETLVGPIVKSVQELYTDLRARDVKIQDLERQNAELKSTLCEMNPKAKICRASSF